MSYDDTLRDAQTDELIRCRDPRYSSSPFRTASDLNSVFPSNVSRRTSSLTLPRSLRVACPALFRLQFFDDVQLEVVLIANSTGLLED